MWLTYAMLAAVFAALTAVFSKAGLKGLDAHLATAWRVTMVVPLAWAAAWWTGGAARTEGLTRPAWLFLALSAAATGLSWIFYFQALKAGETARVSAVDKFSLVLTLVLAALFLGEPMSARTVAGVAAITAGTLLIVW